MKNKKKILFVEQNQDGTVGGSHYCLLYLIKCLNKKKYKPIVMFYEPNAIIGKFAREGCPLVLYKKPLGKFFEPPSSVLKLPYIIARKAFNFISTSLIPLIRFILFIIKNDVDLIHLNNSAHSGWEWLIAAKLLQKKCIAHQRGFAKFGVLVGKRAKCFDKIICVSKAIENYLNKNGILNNTITIYDGMDPQGFAKRIRKSIAQVKNELNIDLDSPLIGVVGNFQEWKGQLTVIKALDLLRRKYPELICLLIGDVSSTNKQDIEYLQKVRQEIHDRDLKTNIIITGYRSDVPDLINSLDVMIHSSIEPEPFGMVSLEGMCLKKAVIATNIGGPMEIIENGASGILVPPGNPSVLAEKIQFLLEHPAVRDRIGKNALKRVEQNFDLNRFSCKINALYDELLGR